MEKLIIYKNNHTVEDVLWIILDITAIVLAILKERYVIFAPMILIFTLPVVKNAILWMKWYNSYAVKIENSELVLNHSLIFKKLHIPLENIQDVNIERQCLILKEPVRIPLWGCSLKRITFSNLTDSERKDVFLFLDFLCLNEKEMKAV